MAKLCYDMAKEVYIDPDEMYVYIGENHNIPQSSIVEYTEHDPHEYATDFFKQWEKTRMLVFEFVLYNAIKRAVFSLKGLWDRDKWHALRIHKGNPSLNVLRKPLSAWGTFSTHNTVKKGT